MPVSKSLRLPTKRNYLARSSIVPSISHAHVKLPLPILLLSRSFASLFRSSNSPSSYSNLPISVDLPASTCPTNQGLERTQMLVRRCLPMTTRLTSFFLLASNDLRASSRTFSRANEILGGGSYVGSSFSSESRPREAISIACWSRGDLRWGGFAGGAVFLFPACLLDAFVGEGAGEAVREFEAEDAPDLRFCNCLFFAFSAFSRSRLALKCSQHEVCLRTKAQC